MIVRCDSCGGSFSVDGEDASQFNCPDCPESMAAFVTNNPGLAAADSVLYASGEFEAVRRPSKPRTAEVSKHDKLAKLRADLKNRSANRK